MKDLKEPLKIFYQNLIYWSVFLTVFIVIFCLIFGMQFYLAGCHIDCLFADDPVICKTLKEKGHD